MSNNEQRRAALIDEAQKLQQRLGQIQAELGEMAQAEHDANHASLRAATLQYQQAFLLAQEERQRESAQRRTEQETEWRAKHLDGAEVQRQAREYTAQVTGIRLK